MSTLAARPASADGEIVARAEPTASARFAALDVFRFAAVLLMVQGHTFHALLDPAVHPERWHRWHSYLHGHTAPMFMIASGLAFGITTFRAWDAHGVLGPAVGKRLERYALIIGIGYFLHLPAWSFRALAHAPDDRMLAFFEVDALQAIGLTLLVAELALFAVRSRRVYVGAALAVAVLAIGLGPWASSLATDGMPTALAAFVNGHDGSTFPLLPWSGYLAAGIVIAHFVHRALERGGLSDLAPKLAAWGAGLVVCALVAKRFVPDVFGEHPFWKVSPFLAAFRIGVILVALGLLCHLEPWLARRAAAPGGAPSVVQTIAMETLVVYVAHLVVLYGSPIHAGLHRMVGPTQSVAGAAVIATLLLASTCAFAIAWHFTKKTWPRRFRIAQLSLAGGVLAYALLSPG